MQCAVYISMLETPNQNCYPRFIFSFFAVIVQIVFGVHSSNRQAEKLCFFLLSSAICQAERWHGLTRMNLHLWGAPPWVWPTGRQAGRQAGWNGWCWWCVMRRYSYLRNENDDKVSVRLLTWQWLHKATKASVVGLDSSWVLLRRTMCIYLSIKGEE